jgi:hypothetical protein
MLYKIFCIKEVWKKKEELISTRKSYVSCWDRFPVSWGKVRGVMHWKTQQSSITVNIEIVILSCDFSGNYSYLQNFSGWQYGEPCQVTITRHRDLATTQPFLLYTRASRLISFSSCSASLRVDCFQRVPQQCSWFVYVRKVIRFPINPGQVLQTFGTSRGRVFEHSYVYLYIYKPAWTFLKDVKSSRFTLFMNTKLTKLTNNNY